MIIVDAGNLPRVLACSGSYVMKADPVYAERDNTIREEGNAAHWLASTVFNGEFTIEEMIDRKAPNGVFITAEMAEHVYEYISIVDCAPDIKLFAEWGYTLNGQNYQINGRPDCLAIAGTYLNIHDFKYGYTIVEPEKNWTLISHAIGYCVENNVAPEKINFFIHQPRAPHHLGRVRSWSISYAELTALFQEMSAKLNNPDNMLRTGPHCDKCPSFFSCPARQAAEMNGIEVAHLAYNADVSDEELSFRLDQLNRAIKLLEQSEKAYSEQAAHRLKNGKIINNYALVSDLANTSWKESVTPELMKILTGKDVSETKLISPAKAKTILGEEFVSDWTERKTKGKKLTRISANARAKQMFGDK